MTDDYAALAPVYDRLGLSSFAETVTPQIIAFAQAQDWAGRRVVDLGCGTGASVRWLTANKFSTVGIDLSSAMLTLAQKSIVGSGVGLRWLQGDMRALDDLHDIDLVLSLDTLNELNSLRDLEMVFGAVFKALAPGKLFVFDLHTIEGLAQRTPLSYMLDTDDLTVLRAEEFDHERLANIAQYTVFERAGYLWRRWSATRTLRGFPIQVVNALLGRAGFGIMALMTEQMQQFDPTAMRAGRVVFFAQKPESV
ncbi:MAG: class I SAM-dependent methyltransferase [Anaerolineae bacterium]|nr:class I SAM-dependent methyltransferase [Anaerolineae bacterium]